ncbi:cytidylyltransferase domain-containing protein [Sporocytophaga myxococcoides]|uniref:acylneuraminate cytidylyltransferase family protein n=1 Tax=Sporocytophaga myxococcoides TaxID=153721 RepID=UPI000410BF6F|nr:acylneuraminate cytidylyltransferase family protein [Sporocytophaga myxococcoides]
MSTTNKVTVFLPCRAGSQRVVKKNIKDFANIKGGLTRIKIEQLLNMKSLETLIVSTDDEEVKEIARSFKDSKVLIDDRPAHLASSSTSTDELINYVPQIINEGIVLWTHVTSPFIDAEDYDLFLSKYFEGLENGYDSLMTVNKIHKFLWNESGSVNYDRTLEKWPRTQTLPPLFEINSGAFIADIDIYLNMKDRIGKNPLMLEIDELKAFDIDWELNFKTAEFYWLNKF